MTAKVMGKHWEVFCDILGITLDLPIRVHYCPTLYIMPPSWTDWNVTIVVIFKRGRFRWQTFIRGRAIVQLLLMFSIGSCINLNFATDLALPILTVYFHEKAPFFFLHYIINTKLVISLLSETKPRTQKQAN